MPAPPNPVGLADPEGTQFGAYIAASGIHPVEHPALASYQHAAEGRFLSASTLNHCLTLDGEGRLYGEFGSHGETAEDIRGSLEDYTDPKGPDYRYHAQILDSLFREHGIRFSAESTVFKGVGGSEFYEYLRFDRARVGDTIKFHGYVSTTVRRASAEKFASANILLILTRLDRVNALVPPNETVKNAPMGSYPEQEILLDRGISFAVTNVDVCPAISPSAASLRVLTVEAM